MTADINQLKQLYESGYSLEQCCQIVGLKSPGSLLKRFRNNGIRVRTLTEVNQKRAFDLPKQQVINMYQAGLSCSDIGEYLGCSGRTIYKYLVRWGIQVRSFSDALTLATGSLLTKGSRELIIKLRFEQGMKYKHIAQRTGINYEVVKNFGCRHKRLFR